MKTFPKDFEFGVSSSATQIEGAFLEDGKKLNVWDAFSHIPGNIKNGDTTAVACDSYHRYKEDVALMKEIGVQAYRFSTSWARVLPDGKGKVNQKGLDYYNRLVDCLLENGISPTLCLYHWDTPYELERIGGWLNRDCADYFAEYASVVYKSLGDRVKKFATMNEPYGVYVGYAKKDFAPGYAVEKYGKQAVHNLLLAHGKSVSAFRASGAKGEIGVIIDIWNNYAPKAENKAMVDFAIKENENRYKIFLDPILNGRYTDYQLDLMRKEGSTPEMQEGDMQIISQPMDWFGLNSYNKIIFDDPWPAHNEVEPGEHYLFNGDRYYPETLYESIKMLREEYQLNIPLYISENGTFGYDEKVVDGMVEDPHRVNYIKNFMRELLRANEDGYDVKGYYIWTLLDNFEWASGYTSKYGICSVDPKTLDRKMKRSAWEYKKIIQTRTLEE